MRIPAGLEKARLNISRAAELISMNTGHFRRMVRRGVFPNPKRTSKGMPYYDHELLTQIAEVLHTGVGLNSEEVCFYRRHSKRQKPPQRASDKRRAVDPYLKSVIDGCRQLGVDNAHLEPSAITAVLGTVFGNDRPPLERAVPEVARRILAGE